LPRWRPDGTKNPLQIQRLKNKMGNVANASSETELRGAYAVMIGGEGRGVATILKMVSMTRFDCMIGSAAGMRQAVVQALHHCAHRSAFGKRLTDQPLMQNVLADLVIESEAALMMTMRIARSLDRSDRDESEKLLMRIGTAVGKYWICKRTPGHAYEAMECIGGSGVMEDSIMPRLFRESPVNAIWEGSGNVQCLDMLRAMQREPASLEAFMREVQRAAGANQHLDHYIAQLGREFADLTDIEYRARTVVEKMSLALQGALLVQHGHPAVADAFCASRLAGQSSGLVYGNLPRGVDCSAMIKRAMPQG
jgi:putative acyl-CoA dehydrogenase